MGSGKQELVPNASAILRSYCLSVQETYDKSADIVSDPAFHRLGLTDTAILCLGNEQVTVLTVDFQLFNRLHEKKVKVINILNAP